MGLPDERALIDRITAGLRSRTNRAGFSSDCAVIPLGEDDLVASVDGFASATHFPDGLGPQRAGRLAAGATLADLAAAGAEVLGILSAYGIPEDADPAEIVELADAIATTVEDAGGEILGGDTKPREELTLTLTALGTCPASTAMTRARARTGDHVLVTGPLGGAGAALDRIQEGLDPAEADPLVPTPRLEAGRLLREAGVECAMDLSDGLADAAVAIAEASEVHVAIDAEAVPLHAWAREAGDGLDHALSTGGDYELLATVPEGSLDAMLDELAGLGLDPAVVGRVEEGEGALMRRGGEEAELERGYQHSFGGG